MKRESDLELFSFDDYKEFQEEKTRIDKILNRKPKIKLVLGNIKQEKIELVEPLPDYDEDVFFSINRKD